MRRACHLSSLFNMRVVICPAAFKESFTASQAAAAMLEGVRRALPGADVHVHPMSDGGSDLVDVLLYTVGGEIEPVVVTGPIGERVTARILWLSEEEAVIGTAEACGLDLIPADRRDPAVTTTRGVGQLLRACAAGAARSIRIGLGGSGTVDGGAGMASALGFSLTDADGESLEPGGAGLVRLTSIGTPTASRSALEGIACTALADVESPLFGTDGAARRFGPQKGADQDLVEILDLGLRRLDQRWIADLGVAVSGQPGAGAAGGLGAGCAAFLGADLVAGAPWVADRSGLPDALDGADLVITGEGAFDKGSRLGKATWHVASLARRAEAPCLLIAGRIEGRLPDGTRGAASDGGGLDLAGLEALTERAVRRSDA